MDKKPTVPKKMDVNARELHKLEFIAGLDAQLIQGGGDSEGAPGHNSKRMAQFPTGDNNHAARAGCNI